MVGVGVIKIAIVTKTATHSKINIFLLLIDSDYSIPQSGNNVKRLGRKGAVSAQCWVGTTPGRAQQQRAAERANKENPTTPHFSTLSTVVRSHDRF